MKAQFEWRPEYTIDIDVTDNVVMVINKPWYGDYGLYNFFHGEVEDNTIRLIPNFMFGLTQEVLDILYSGPEYIPSSGILSHSTGTRIQT